MSRRNGLLVSELAYLALLDIQIHIRWYSEKLESFGDIAMRTERHDDAILQYSTALSFDSESPPDLLVKRSKAYIAKGLWKDALNDANKVCSVVLCSLHDVNAQ
jgi:hypothetical protein